MPAFLVPVFAALGAGAAAATLATIATTILINFALGALSRMLSGSPPKYSAPAVNVTVRGSIENRHLVFGRRRCAGVLLFYGVSGPNNKYLWYVVGLAGHRPEAVHDVWIPQ